MEAGAPDAARRRFKTQRGSKPGRGVWIAAMALVLAAAHVLKSSGAGWSGVVGSAAQQVHLAAASLVGHAAASGGSIAGGAGGEGGGAGGKGDGGGGEGGGDPELPCRESGYCSVGKLQAYVGEVDSTEGFKAMLNASCYKKECIMLTIGTSAHLLGVNFVAGAWKLGLANVMLYARSNESCAVLAAAGYHNITCVWSERPWFRTQGEGWSIGEPLDMWAVRYILMARAVWHGYNVWLLDSDSYLYQDPYKYLTVPPLSNITWMSLQDGGATVNGGASYIHNAAPGGPAAWTIAAVAERLIRVNEQWEALVELNKLPDKHNLGHNMMDQARGELPAGTAADMQGAACRDRGRAQRQLAALLDAFPLPLQPYAPPPATKGSAEKPSGGTLAGAHHSATLMKDPHSLLHYHDPGVLLRYPPAWHNLTNATEGKMMGFDLTVPYLNGTWDESIAGKRFPPRLNYSEAFIKMIEEESGIKYPDTDGAPPADYVPLNETFIFTPDWFLASWLNRGLTGWFDLRPPPQVMVHMLFIPGPHDSWKKEYVMKAAGAFHFEVAQALRGQLFPAATPEAPLPRVLALLPGVRLPSETALEYRDELLQLVRLAGRLGRVLLLPDPVCNATWLGFGEQQERAPPGHRKSFLDIEALLIYGLDDDQRCTWWRAVDPDCMAGRYIVHLDYLELVRRLPEGTGQPSGDNTVQLGGLERAQEQGGVDAAETKAEEGGGEKQAQGRSPAGAPKRRRRKLAEDSAPKEQQQQQAPKGASLAATAEAAKQKDGPHILFLDAIPDLTPGSWPEEDEADKGWKEWIAKCKWGHEDPPIKQQQARRRLGERGWHQQHWEEALLHASQRHVHELNRSLNVNNTAALPVALVPQGSWVSSIPRQAADPGGRGKPRTALPIQWMTVNPGGPS
ncbi:hypothetical protein CHLNCDRAFT_55126 [Chlorella variabilis]|uniref:Nucleotide-diphospho-sugar transferase domain-containing protein n=1 Tax=Chlorella variabilis TaxID=554065 RepID=E1ZRX0_CHLVA|nr:hypothetical protein CHLNCDRAFT_55126 [Chlorella variabilis]EFN51412.1 hypothetical protein CHLNCDRAFT_55126 [Chlorella variabilis]|eukprot:XP_005843514.1 hypothetical protein CHLNCDRAFT_55126 [Chlorella variabilis]